jgi:SAM-dependent methyltransferase
MAAGSFDHHIYLLNRSDVLWQHKVDDRVWGVSISKSGEFVVAGADDGNIYFIRNLCLEASLDLLKTELNKLLHENNECDTATSAHMMGATFYLENNLLDKALKGAEKAYELLPDDEATTVLLNEIYHRKLNLNPEDYETHFKLGLLYKKKKEFDEATKQFGLASSDPRLTDKAISLIHECINSSIVRDATLVYDDITYIKYEHPSLEDEIKKNIEMFHALTKIRSVPNVYRTLDIGCGTGRYPFALVYQGYDAIGIDVSPEAIKKCNMTKELEETRWGKLKLKFLCMDGRRTLFEDSSFDLVTCMMGTFAHFTLGEKRALLLEIRRILRPNGHVIISTWNPRYANAKYLGFYRKRDRDALRQNLITDTELKGLLMEVGFSDVDVTQFAFLPDEFYYELDLDNLRKEYFQKILMIESLTAKSFPVLEGQMYLLHAQKKEIEERFREWRSVNT